MIRLQYRETAMNAVDFQKGKLFAAQNPAIKSYAASVVPSAAAEQ
jgi:hypothetical protein